LTEGGEGDEPYQAFENRIKQFLQDTITSFGGKTVLIVSHGDPLFLMKHILEGK